MNPVDSTRSHSAVRSSVLVLSLAVISCLVFYWPSVTRILGRNSKEAAKVSENLRDAEAGHDHGAETDTDSLELSVAAKKNLGLTSEFLKPIRLSSYRRSITIPAVVIVRPGRSLIQVSTPLTGLVTHVHAVSGEAVTPGTLLFEIQLTHEELVTAQTDFLKTLGELDVETLEIARLENVAESGAISGRNLIERKYNRDKLTATLKALREALKLHGLSDNHVDAIQNERKLLRSLQIMAPDIDRHHHNEELHLSHVSVIPVSQRRDEAHDHKGTSQSASADARPADEHASDQHARPLVIGELSVIKGQSVKAGDKLCVVADFEHLFIEGQAFDQDAPAINSLGVKNWTLTALIPGKDHIESVSDLTLAYLGTEVDLHARTLPLFVKLPNQLLRDQTNEDGQRFVSWKYRPGQRLQLQVPVEEWTEQIVLPFDAVATEGAESFVFRQNGRHFERVSVHAIHQSQMDVVIANDGTLFPGDVIAMKSAHQMLLALKNKSGVGADPHAGHSH